MKRLALLFTTLAITSGFAQDEKYLKPVPNSITGEWKVSESKENTNIESIVFYPDGLLNVNSKRRGKLIQGYKVVERANGYEIFITAMHFAPPIASFKIKLLKESLMQITIQKDNASQTLTFKKIRHIPSGIVPLKAG